MELPDYYIHHYRSVKVPNVISGSANMSMDTFHLIARFLSPPIFFSFLKSLFLRIAGMLKAVYQPLALSLF